MDGLVERSPERLLALSDTVPNGGLIMRSFGRNPHCFPMDRMAGTAEVPVVFAASFVPAAALYAESRNRQATGPCRNDKVDSKRTILPTAFQNVPGLDENIDRFGKVFSLELPDGSRLVNTDLFFLKRFFQRNVAASINSGRVRGKEKS